MSPLKSCNIRPGVRHQILQFGKIQLGTKGTLHLTIRPSEQWNVMPLIPDFGGPYPSQDSSIGSILAWYWGGLGSNPGKGANFSVKISN